MIAFIFPGQGSQVVGMGRALHHAFPVARAAFEEADAAFAGASGDADPGRAGGDAPGSRRLTQIVFDGP